MKQDLLDVFSKIDCNDYTLKEIAYYFEKYDGYVLKIETTNYSLKTKIDKYALPHILGLHYAVSNKKDSKEYKGKLGFEKLKKRRTRFRIISKDNIARDTPLKGKYALFKIIKEAGKDVYPMISLKEISDKKIVLETFIIEDNISFLGGLQEEKIEKIELITPLDVTLPRITIKEKEAIES